MPKNRDYTGLARTPSSMAWLIRERAKLKGQKIDRQLEDLPRQRVALEQALQALDSVIPPHEVPVDPKEIKGVRPHKTPLVPYGGIAKGILECLRLAGGEARFTTEIVSTLLVGTAWI